MKKMKYLFLFFYTLLVLLSLFMMGQEEGLRFLGFIILMITTFPMGFLALIPILLLGGAINLSPLSMNIISYGSVFLTISLGYYQWFILFPKKFIETGRYKKYKRKDVIDILLIFFIIFLVFNSIFYLKYPNNVIWTSIWIVFALLFKYKGGK